MMYNFIFKNSSQFNTINHTLESSRIHQIHNCKVKPLQKVYSFSEFKQLPKYTQQKMNATQGLNSNLKEGHNFEKTPSLYTEANNQLKAKSQLTPTGMNQRNQNKQFPKNKHERGNSIINKQQQIKGNLKQTNKWDAKKHRRERQSNSIKIIEQGQLERDQETNRMVETIEELNNRIEEVQKENIVYHRKYEEILLKYEQLLIMYKEKDEVSSMSFMETELNKSRLLNQRLQKEVEMQVQELRQYEHKNEQSRKLLQKLNDNINKRQLKLTKQISDLKIVNEQKSEQLQYAQSTSMKLSQDLAKATHENKQLRIQIQELRNTKNISEEFNISKDKNQFTIECKQILNNQFSSQKNQQQQVQGIIEQLRRKEKQLQNKLNEAQLAIKNQQQRLNQYEDSNKEHERKLSEKELNLIEKQKHLVQAQENIRKLQAKLQQQRKQIHNLNNSVILTLQQKNNTLQEEYIELQKEDDRLQNKLTMLQQQLSELQTVNTELQKQFEGIQNQKKVMQEQKNEVERQLERVRLQKETVDNKLGEIQERIQSMKVEYESKINLLKNEKQGMNAGYSELEEKIERSEKQVQIMTVKYKNIDNSYKEMEAKLIRSEKMIQVHKDQYNKLKVMKEKKWEQMKSIYEGQIQLLTSKLKAKGVYFQQ